MADMDFDQTIGIAPQFSSYALDERQVLLLSEQRSFRLTGKRIFRMAPIHHHFEQLGWSEPQIVMRFWIIAFVLAMVGLASLKLR